ncbi:DUF4190 domain-containing protein [Agromyces sp. NPDC057679]|uniref:DUF4190 domain-containing protein n=1 Tax=Agromyces sp. NPDC057679 TaxID=3346207 RepID=UPI00366A8FAA
MTDPNLPEQPAGAVPPVPPAAPATPPAAPAYGTPPAAPAAPAYAAPAYGAPAPTKTNVLAIVSLVSAFFVSLVAIITGHIALSQIKKTGEQGRGLAIAGLIIGYVGLVATIVVVILWIAAFAFVASNPDITTY